MSHFICIKKPAGLLRYPDKKGVSRSDVFTILLQKHVILAETLARRHRYIWAVLIEKSGLKLVGKSWLPALHTTGWTPSPTTHWSSRVLWRCGPWPMGFIGFSGGKGIKANGPSGVQAQVHSCLHKLSQTFKTHKLYIHLIYKIRTVYFPVRNKKWILILFSLTPIMND